jgi:hypothetical protein
MDEDCLMLGDGCQCGLAEAAGLQASTNNGDSWSSRAVIKSDNNIQPLMSMLMMLLLQPLTPLAPMVSQTDDKHNKSTARRYS